MSSIMKTVFVLVYYMISTIPTSGQTLERQTADLLLEVGAALKTLDSKKCEKIAVVSIKGRNLYKALEKINAQRIYQHQKSHEADIAKFTDGSPNQLCAAMMLLVMTQGLSDKGLVEMLPVK